MRLTPPPSMLKGVIGEIVTSLKLPYSARVIAIWLILHHEDTPSVTIRVIERALWASFATATNSLQRLAQERIVVEGENHTFALADEWRAKAVAEMAR